jgi:hypothetical protein
MLTAPQGRLCRTLNQPWVPLSLGLADLQNDCGDLILLADDGPLLLLSDPQGNQVRDPSAPRRPARIQAKDIKSAQNLARNFKEDE